MRAETGDDVWVKLKLYPNGATVNELAGSLGQPRNNVGAKLSKLYFYGFLDRVPIPGPKNSRMYRYSVKRMTAAE